MYLLGYVLITYYLKPITYNPTPYTLNLLPF